MKLTSGRYGGAYRENWDYRFGNWIEGMRNIAMVRNAQEMYKNERAMLAILEENASLNALRIQAMQENLNKVHFSASHFDSNEEDISSFTYQACYKGGK